jgi:signal transduction histidine kinase
MAERAAVEPVNILMVDDAPGKLLSYEAMLAGLGENLIKAYSAREAMAALLRHDIAVILLDVSMPEIDGFELAQLVREHPRSQQTPIIFVSAIHLSDLDKLKGYQAGAVDYVAVPVIPDILRAKVRVFVELHRKTRELRALNDELEARVKARTIDLERSLAKLQEREVTLREADRRKDEFLALLGHELRNPLAPIQHAVELMRRRTRGGESVDDVADVVERQVLHLTRLVDDLLDASRVSRGKVVLNRRTLELTGLIREVVESMRALDKGRHLFELSLSADPILVDGDPVRLTQVVSNLVSNAVKFTGDGGWIVVSAHASGGEALIEVADTGCGIDPEDLAQVFDMFYQADTAAGVDKGGLGLGLTLVRQFVELHGGTVTITSDGRDKGCRIAARIPMLQAAADVAPASDAAQDDASHPASSSGEPRRILIVDDNRDAALSLGELLSLEGATVAYAFDGVEAQQAASQFEPHVVLLDIGLPKLDGYGVASALRADPRAQRALIIAMTGWGQLDDKRRTAESGFDAHLVKPVSISTVLQTIDRLQPAIPAT